MKVAIYARVSTEQQIENYSIPLQLERMRAYCMSRGWEDVDEFVDPGYSGSNLERPAIQKLLKNIKDYNMVVVYKLDRLSRSQKDTLFLIEDKLLANSVEFTSIMETLDTSSPFGRAMIGILSVFAQLERETITERLTSGRIRMYKENGFWAGGGDRHPTGYTRFKRGELVPNEDAPIVKWIFDEYLEHQSIVKIQDKMKDKGLPVWRFNRIWRVLTNELYIGNLTYGDEEYKGSHELFVDEDKFYKVQSLLEKRKGANWGKVRHNYFSRMVECGKCGVYYESSSSWTKSYDSKGNRTYYRYYICAARRKPRDYGGKCFNKTWSKEKLDKVVFDAIESLTVKDIERSMKSKDIPNYNQQIEKVDEKIKKTLELYLDGIFEKSQLDEKIEELQDQRDVLFQKKKETDEDDTIDQEIINLVEAGIDMRKADVDERKRVVHTLIERILINEEDVLIRWKF